MRGSRLNPRRFCYQLIPWCITAFGDFQVGVADFAPKTAAVRGEDGSVVMVGDAEGTPAHTAAVKYDEDGSVLWDWQVIQKPIQVGRFG